MNLAVTSGASEIAGIIHFITDLKQGNIVAHGLHNAGRVPTQNTRFRVFPRRPLADFHINGIHRNRFHLNKQISSCRFRCRKLHFHQTLRVFGRQRLIHTDSFHVLSPFPVLLRKPNV